MPYQRRFVSDSNRFKIWIAARQVGKSTAVAFEAVLLASAAAGTAIMLVSASQRQSAELLERVRRWVEALKAGVDELVVMKESAQGLRLANGSRILSLPANPDTIRGFSGHIFLDEFAFHRDSRKIWASVFPIATRGFSLRITSTPNGKLNMFHDIWERGGAIWTRHATSIYQATGEGLEVDVELLRSATPDPATWAQEYECRFVDEATAFLTYELIASARHDDAGRPDRAGKGPFYIGADIGRRRDLTVYWTLEEVGDVLWTREVAALSQAPFSAQDAELDRLFGRYRPVRLCMDQGGLGEKMVEDAQGRYGRSRVEGVIFSGPVKQELAMTLRRRFEDQRIRIPDDRDIREELHRIQKTVTAAGNVRFDAARNESGHADRFWALALAVHAAEDPGGKPMIVSGGRRVMARELRGY
ncbi:MAG: terminase family protein [Pseudomonadota bacterium]